MSKKYLKDFAGEMGTVPGTFSYRMKRFEEVRKKADKAREEEKAKQPKVMTVEEFIRYSKD